MGDDAYALGQVGSDARGVCEREEYTDINYPYSTAAARNVKE